MAYKGWRLPTNRLPAATELTESGQVSSAQAILGSPEESKWAARLVGAGSSLTLVYQIGYLVFDQHIVWTNHGLPLILHLLNVGLFLVAVLMTLKVGPWMRRHWKAVAFSFSTIMIISSMWLAIITAEKEPFVIALILFLAGTGPFLSWGEKTQSLLSLVAIVAFAIADAELSHGRSDPYQWLGILIAAAIGLFSTALERRLHRARRRAEEEALKSREMLVAQERIRVAGQLTSGIAHDLNNTLNVIKLRLAALVQDDAIVNKHEAPLRAIERAVDDAALTVARVRELGRNREHDQKQSSHLSEVITDAIDLARTTIEGKSSLEGAPIRIQSRIPASLPKVNGSASELRQLFLNLLLNASEAVNLGGEIVIDCVFQDNLVVVRVSDDGPGIPPEQLEQVFDLFFTTKGPRGTGLGLPIVRNIMESIGGRIAAGNGPASGAVITLEFPIAAQPPTNNKQSSPALSSGQRCFLLIDDDSENLAALKEALVLRGHKADTALSGAEGLEKIRSGVYDVVLCDLAMSGVNGWEVARVALAKNPNLNLYIVTGWGQETRSHIPPNLPIRGVLSKPIDLGELERTATPQP
jgi:signal transduction histidine kinase/CheY-like chemotaxis protein